MFDAQIAPETSSRQFRLTPVNGFDEDMQECADEAPRQGGQLQAGIKNLVPRPRKVVPMSIPPSARIYVWISATPIRLVNAACPTLGPEERFGRQDGGDLPQGVKDREKVQRGEWVGQVDTG